VNVLTENISSANALLEKWAVEKERVSTGKRIVYDRL